MASRPYRIFVCCAILAIVALGCNGKPSKESAPSKEPSAKGPAPDKPSPPKPPALKLKLADVLRARTVELCALSHKESSVDARTVAIDMLAQRPYQPAGSVSRNESPPTPPDAKEHREGEKGDVAVAVAQDSKPKATATPKTAPKPSVVVADPTAAVQATSRTPGGRNGLTSRDRQLVADYEHDVKAIDAWPAYKGRVAAGVDGCLWAPELGLVDKELIDRYVKAFVEITCMQEKHRDPAGKIDALSHARAAVEVFGRYKFTAPQFARIGVPMGRFQVVQAAIQQARATACPDKRAKDETLPGEGAFTGELKGKLRGAISVVAKGGKLSGTVVVKPRRKKDKALSMNLEGTMFGQRVHMNGTVGQDFLRFDCKAGVKRCLWSGQVGFSNVSGTFSLKKPPPPPSPAKSPVQNSPEAMALVGDAKAAPGVPPPVQAQAKAPKPPKGPKTVAPSPPKPRGPALPPAKPGVPAPAAPAAPTR